MPGDAEAPTPQPQAGSEHQAATRDASAAASPPPALASNGDDGKMPRRAKAARQVMPAATRDPELADGDLV